MLEALLSPRTIRSYVRREGRITEAQKRSLKRLWPTYGIDTDSGLLGQIVGYENSEFSLEIGFGDGDALLSLAKENPMRCFIGIDPHRPGAGRLLLRLQQEGIENVRIAIGDAAQLVPMIDPGSLSQILILFPDPWPKKRHHKRRLLTADFLHILSEKLQLQGRLHIATDWQEYADEILTALDATPALENEAGPLAFSKRPDWRPLTKYERRGLRLGHQIFDIAAVKR